MKMQATAFWFERLLDAYPDLCQVLFVLGPVEYMKLS